MRIERGRQLPKLPCETIESEKYRVVELPDMFHLQELTCKLFSSLRSGICLGEPQLEMTEILGLLRLGCPKQLIIMPHLKLINCVCVC